MVAKTETQHVHTRTGMTVDAFRRAFIDNLYYLRGKAPSYATPHDSYVALAYTVRDRLMQRRQATRQAYFAAKTKAVYYLSAEYLMGRQLRQNLMSSGSIELARESLAELGLNLDDLIELEPEPGLGNGGLGRLVACFLDSLATMNIPTIGYGIRYEFGIFNQSIQDGWQVESPDNWLYVDNPWDIAYPDDAVEVGFGGHTEFYHDETGQTRVRWVPERTVRRWGSDA